MSLSEIKNKLYSKKTSENLSQHSYNEFDVKAQEKKGQTGFDEKDVWQEKKGLNEEQKKAIRLGGKIVAGILAGAFVVFGIFNLINSSFKENKVILQTSGLEKVSSGQLLAFEISYANNNRATLKGAILRVTYPESFTPGENANFKVESQTSGVFNIGDIPGKSSGKVILNGNIYSPRGTLAYIKSDLIYTPSNFNSQFDTKSQLAINVDSSPIDLEILAPQQIASGNSIDYEITYTNTGKEDFDGIKVKIEYPQNFTFTRANPAVSEDNNIWYIGHLSAGQSGKVIASGKLEGNKDEVKNAKAYIGASLANQLVGYNEEQASTQIIAAPFTVIQQVNGSESYIAKSGDILRFEIAFRNDNNIDLRNVILTEKIDSPVLDYSTLNIKNGAFDANTKTITWKSVDLPVLANLSPGQGGGVTFSIRVKDVIPMNGVNDKNYIISAIAKIDSPDVQTPISANKVVSGNILGIKLDSKLVLDTRGYYNDSTIVNSGPIPPKVGNSTTYTIHWKAFNVSNDVSEAKVVASLPTGVRMTGKTMPDDGRLTYDSRNNNVIWDIGKLSAGVGILSAAPEMAFQVEINPSQNQVDTTPTLVNPAVFSAKDLFTGSQLLFQSDAKSTVLSEDSGLGNNHRVVP